MTSASLPPGLLTPRRVSGPVPWIIGIMAFLMALAGAAALGLARAAAGAGAGVQRQQLVQIVDADPARRDHTALAALGVLRAAPGINAKPVPPAQLAAELTPWLGNAHDLPLPAAIDVTRAPGASLPAAALSRLGPTVRVESPAALLGPLGAFLATLGWLALAIVLMMALVAVAATVLAARAAFDAHRDAVEVLHLMGATDLQLARAFQRRVGIDAAIGAAGGAAAGVLVAALVASRLGALDAGLASRGLAPIDWLLVALLPLAGAALASLAARRTVVQALAARP